jgi:hypothetical protein
MGADVRRIWAVVAAIALAVWPAPAGAAGYADPPGWCTRYSDMWSATVVTNDPLVATNPERDTFYGFHPDPGYDDWYGYFYGDFRGRPGDSSGWVKLLHENYPDHYFWNFAGNGWAVHGHVRQYIAYYNWTFGGQCGFGHYGSLSPPAYMADQYGWPVVDIYVDAIAPYDPQPRVVAATATSVTFTWDPVADRGDGAGQDYFEAGMDHYTSWITTGSGPAMQQFASTVSTRVVTQSLAPDQTACLHVQAFDRLRNASAERVVCGQALLPPSMPNWTADTQIAAAPRIGGLAGFATWFWLVPAVRPLVVTESSDGVSYVITATPEGADWNFGDGAAARFSGTDGFGVAYPAPSPIHHIFESDNQSGFQVRASVRYDVSYKAVIGGTTFGPNPLGSVELPAGPLTYPVQQAQPELVMTD